MNSMLLAFATLDARLALECRLLSLRRHERAVRIGVHEFERHKPQRLWFDVDLCVRLQHAGAARDDIAHTLDYDFVRELIAQAVGRQHHELQETLCDEVLALMLEHPRVRAARVSTEKPDVYPDCAAVGVEVFGIKETSP